MTHLLSALALAYLCFGVGAAFGAGLTLALGPHADGWRMMRGDR